MTGLFRRGRTQVSERGPAVLAAALIYGGIHQIISTAQYPFTNLVVLLINPIVERQFHYHLTPYGWVGLPPAFLVEGLALAIIVIVAGILVGLWADVRCARQSASKSPRRSEG